MLQRNKRNISYFQTDWFRLFLIILLFFLVLYIFEINLVDTAYAADGRPKKEPLRIFVKVVIAVSVLSGTVLLATTALNLIPIAPILMWFMQVDLLPLVDVHTAYNNLPLIVRGNHEYSMHMVWSYRPNLNRRQYLNFLLETLSNLTPEEGRAFLKKELDSMQFAYDSTIKDLSPNKDFAEKLRLCNDALQSDDWQRAVRIFKARKSHSIGGYFNR